MSLKICYRYFVYSFLFIFFHLTNKHFNNFPSQGFTIPEICTKTGKSHFYRSNIWLGPADVVSPCHYDPFQNVLCQVIGSKRVILYSPSDSEYLYPARGTVQKNTSLVDIENPDYARFPNFGKARALVADLHAGDMLFIPYKFWHFTRSTSTSCSLNFWWL